VANVGHEEALELFRTPLVLNGGGNDGCNVRDKSSAIIIIEIGEGKIEIPRDCLPRPNAESVNMNETKKLYGK